MVPAPKSWIRAHSSAPASVRWCVLDGSFAQSVCASEVRKCLNRVCLTSGLGNAQRLVVPSLMSQSMAVVPFQGLHGIARSAPAV